MTVTSWRTTAAPSPRGAAGTRASGSSAATPGTAARCSSRTRQTPARPEQATVTPLRWRQRAEQARDGIDADRRRRREAAVPVTPKPPPPLGASYRERNVFVLPDDDGEDRGPADRG